MDNRFHSTVLQRPGGSGSGGGDDEDHRERHDRHNRRDVLNHAGSAQRHSSFNLRSPTQPEFHSQPYASPGRHNTTPIPHHQSPPQARQTLHNPNPYMASSSSASAGPQGGPVAPSLPPLGGRPSSSSAATSSSSAAANNHHQAPPVSPLHPPTGYYPPPSASSTSSDRHHSRDKPAAGSFYDPTTDTTKERRPSESWHNASQATPPKVSKQATAGQPSPLLFFQTCLVPLPPEHKPEPPTESPLATYPCQRQANFSLIPTIAITIVTLPFH